MYQNHTLTGVPVHPHPFDKGLELQPNRLHDTVQKKTQSTKIWKFGF